MFDPSSIAIVVLTFLLAGTVKGVIGLGLPSVSLAVLAVLFDLETAMALLLVPSFVTNVWQGVVGGNLRRILRKLWPFLISATLAVWCGALIVKDVSPDILTGLLGALLMIYSGLSLRGLSFNLEPKSQKWWAPIVGAINGILTGMTGSFVVPGVLYLQSIGLDRNVFVQAMGVLFTLSTLALGLTLQNADLLGAELAQMSAIGLIPALAGMGLGRRIRQRLSEQQFRRLFFAALFAMGGYILLSGLFSYMA